jgi:hypothetical protein
MTSDSRLRVLAWAATTMLHRHNAEANDHDAVADAKQLLLSPPFPGVMESTAAAAATDPFDHDDVASNDETEDETEEEETEDEESDDEEWEDDDSQSQYRKASVQVAVAADSTAENHNDENAPYWMHKDWMPMTHGTGKQKSPHQIRTELNRYMETMDRTKTSILHDMKVNSNSFRKFMNPDNYKDPWRASTFNNY